MSQSAIRLQRLEEFQIEIPVKESICDLLQACFPGYPRNRAYFKQVPSFRYLLWDREKLVAHMAVEHRILNNSGELHTIFGIADLCVHPDYQHRKLASWLIMELETLGKIHDIDFLVLVARDQQFYHSHDFLSVTNDCQWVLINSHTTYGIAHRSIGQGLMVKSLGEKTWSDGFVDFLGHMF